MTTQTVARTKEPDQRTPDAIVSERPRWARPALAVILVATAALYLVDLSASGYANDFYAAAVQAGTKSWKAFFFGSFDSASAITVDKPPASLWVMELSSRIFGFNSWSMLVPQALEGVAAVALLHAAVRRVSGYGAALVAAAAFAITPVAVLMFRFNNPDALLVLLLVAGAYCLTRSLETASTRWLLLAGAMVGFGFITKLGQALLVVPAFGLVYLIAAPAGFRRRILQLLAGGAAMVVAGGWWVAAVALTPAADRPYVGGSTSNSVLQLALGYNGAGRLFGGDGNGGGGGGGARAGGGGGGAFGGQAGLGRLFGTTMETQISWLLPGALIALALGLVLTLRRGWTDRTRAALLLWGLTLGVSGIIFSLSKGTIHPYYTIAIAPAIAALIGIGGHLLWTSRSVLLGRIGLAAIVAVTAIWDIHLLNTSTSHPWVRVVVGVAGVLAVLGLVVSSFIRIRALIALSLTLAIVTGGAGTSAWALSTASTAHTGSQPTAGPASAGRGGLGGGRAPAGGFPGGGAPTGGFPGGAAPTGGFGGARSGFGGAGGGGFGGTTTANAALTAALKATTTKWAAAGVGAMTAGPLELASGKAIIAVGGFTGSDPSPTLAQFEAIVAKGQVRYFLGGGSGRAGAGGAGRGGFGGGGFGGGGFGGGGFGGGGGTTSRDSSAISSWVEAHYQSTTIGGQTVYDFTKPVASTS